MQLQLLIYFSLGEEDCWSKLAVFEVQLQTLVIELEFPLEENILSYVSCYII